ncbi:DNA/RNA non-specific endonuclease [Streptomyces sp. CB00455]|uniref:DNA/RNA non-specific endonuclease n=1 Tax=Streptomyces sp. CB00455 TaxID=1703927 RepID=UPI0009A0DB43|nr:DNA/RNA non-specific endonuclease [Streptomyces sp. CB00455]
MLTSALDLLNMLLGTNPDYTPDQTPSTHNAPGAAPGTGNGQDDSRDCRRGGKGWIDPTNVDASNGNRAVKMDGCLDPTIVKGGSATNNQVRPPGYEWARRTAGWLGLSPERAINNCHLIGNDLGGSGTDLRNLATCSRQANVKVRGAGEITDHMRSYEERVRQAVDSGQIVRYTVEPQYAGSRTVPTGFSITARGWNQNGAPGININAIVPNSIYSPKYDHWRNLGLFNDTGTTNPIPTGGIR